jgi:glycerol uptake operon antiterminator
MNKEIIPALWDYDNLELAIKSISSNIFLLGASINNVEHSVNRIINANKNLWIDLDMLKGINSDHEGIKFVKNIGFYGVISVKSSAISIAKSVGLKTIQRFFALDSMSLKNGIQNIKRSNPDYIEVLPGMILCDIINEIKLELSLPIIAAGLIRTKRSVERLFEIGVKGISTSDVSLW